MEDTIKSFGISTIFILIISTSLLFFIIGYPALNGQNTILVNNTQFNITKTNLSNNLGNYLTNQNLEINVSSSSSPVTSAQGIELVSTVSNSRSITSQFQQSLNYELKMIGNIFGLNSNTTIWIFTALASMIGLTLLYLTVKWLRLGE